MARTPVVTREPVPDPFRQAFDELTAEHRRVITGGPGSIAIHSPEMTRRRHHVTSDLRDETTVPTRIQALAIMTTARAMDGPSVWNAPAPAARRAGVSEAVIDAWRERRLLPPMRPNDTAIVNDAMEIFPDPHGQPDDIRSGTGAARGAAPDRTDSPDGPRRADGVHA